MNVKKLNQNDFVLMRKELMQKVSIYGLLNIDQKTLVMIAQQFEQINVEFGKHAGKNLYQIVKEDIEYASWMFEREASAQLRNVFLKKLALCDYAVTAQNFFDQYKEK